MEKQVDSMAIDDEFLRPEPAVCRSGKNMLRK